MFTKKIKAQNAMETTNVHSGVIDAQSRYAGINTIALWNFLLESNFVVSLILPPIN